ncbi:MAG: CinA family protein [Candidatus Limnocylindria bacterium]
MGVTDDELLDLAVRVGAACRSRRRTIAVAESCTGGLIAHLLTEVPGSSAYLRGGVIAYANEVKRDQLDVSDEVLVAHGAVSAQVALAMAEGVRRRFGVDVAVAVTGVAGPSGGTPDKPVGLTYVAVVDDGGATARRHRWELDRSGNKRASAAAALALVLDRLDGTSDETPAG